MNDLKILGHMSLSPTIGLTACNSGGTQPTPQAMGSNAIIVKISDIG